MTTTMAAGEDGTVLVEAIEMETATEDLAKAAGEMETMAMEMGQVDFENRKKAEMTTRMRMRIRTMMKDRPNSHLQLSQVNLCLPALRHWYQLYRLLFPVLVVFQ